MNDDIDEIYRAHVQVARSINGLYAIARAVKETVIVLLLVLLLAVFAMSVAALVL